MHSTMVTLPDRGGDMHLRRWGDGAPSVVVLHANGLTALSYRQLIAPLAAEHDILAFDHRGHGRTGLPADPDDLRDWHVYADDAAALLAQHAQPAEGWTLIGHSMGAVTSLMVAASGRIPVRRIVMIEPVVVPVAAHWIARSPMRGVMREILPVARKAAARRASFPDAVAAKNSYAGKPFFARWADGVLDDYLADGLAHDGEAVRLACDPAWEAATFAAQGHSFWQALDAATAATNGRVSAIYAETGSTASGTSRIRLSGQGVRGIVLPAATHLAPQEYPAECAALIADIIRQPEAD
ncbi:alpha/beta fold hydrolase [Aquisalinus flavus]|uniref:Alpha/beta hydrolase n=1 Tax=Aquisalinus flavus TaxID=1526572 RepID=A0A8J2Y5W8_9PROT|nr:alpha/beta hydrolase [Aquisalinus flavus]MBD0426770.1 alpha/beta hydrolase [Aquisalinus flavus]UNE46625.1 alpha/beta hydrolase [Aquisalinus flavus]GGC95860.1 alpha/beta hydrolase [Aquisalinus flavus]